MTDASSIGLALGISLLAASWGAAQTAPERQGLHGAAISGDLEAGTLGSGQGLEQTESEIHQAIQNAASGAGASSAVQPEAVIPSHETGAEGNSAANQPPAASPTNGRTPTLGSVVFDRAEYPVPAKGSGTTGSVTLYIRVNDPYFGPDHQIALGERGPVSLKAVHDGQERLIYTAGGRRSTGEFNGKYPVEFGPMQEVSPGAGIFEVKMILNADLGLVAGDQLVAEYGNPHPLPPGADNQQKISKQTAILAVHDAVFRTDWLVYEVGSDVIVTLIEPDLNRDSRKSETVSAHEIEWTLVDDANGGAVITKTTLDDPAFNARPAGALTETGADTGAFQLVYTIPKSINGIELNPADVMHAKHLVMHYVDVDPAGASAPFEKSKIIGVSNYIQCGTWYGGTANDPLSGTGPHPPCGSSQP